MKLRARIVLALAIVVSLLAVPGWAHAASKPAPTGLAAVSTSRDGVSLKWNAVAGAAKYRVMYSTSKSMAAPTYLRALGPGRDVTGLKPSTTYYFQVRVISATGVNLGPYSKAVKVKTRAKSGYSVLSPLALKSRSATASSMSLLWVSRGAGVRYRVAWATKANFSDAKYARVASRYATISGLAPSKTYYVRVRVITAAGANLSAYSPAIKVTTKAAPKPVVTPPAKNAVTPPSAKPVTPTAPAAPPSAKPVAPSKPPVSNTSALRVVSYNVRCANCYEGVAEEGTWYERRDAVAAAIKAQAPDVIGLQEASQGWLKDDEGKPISLAQFEDLVDRLGDPYTVTNPNRNNCERPSTPTKCVYKDQGASQGTKIVYNADRLTLVDQGSKKLSEVRAADNDRYVAWAVFKQKATGKSFFVADTHLDHTPNGHDATVYYNSRVKQTQEIIDVVAAENPKRLPVFIVGDFNASKWSTPDNGPYRELIAAGYVDPLGNVDRSTYTTTGATVANRINTHVSSFNGFTRKVKATPYVNGTYIDYIWTSRGVRVSEWETVVRADAAGDYIGVIPSDHNMIRVTATLP